jgi:translocation and assembly module TamB
MEVPSRKRRSRGRRWLLRIVAGSHALLFVALAGVLVLVHNLDRTWVKQRLHAFVLASHGVEIDYGAVRVGLLSDVDIRDLVVRSPTRVRGVAPELLRVGHLRARWSTATLFGAGPPVRQVEIEHVTLTVVQDEHGRTSFDDIPSTPSPPLSQEASHLLGSGVPVRELHMADVTLALVRTDHGAVIERDTLRGVVVQAESERRAGAPFLNLALGQPKSPLELVLQRTRPGLPDAAATAHATFVVDASPSLATVTFDLRVLHQDLAPDLVLDHLLELEAAARFDVKDARTEMDVSRLQIGDGVASAVASVQLPDTGSPIVHHAAGDVDVPRVLRLLPSALPVSLARGQLHYQVDELALDRPTATASVNVQGDFSDLHLALASGPLSIAKAHSVLHATPRGEALAFDGSASLDALHVDAGGTQIHADGVSLTLAGQRDNTGAFSNVTLAAKVRSLEAQGALRELASDVQLRLHVPLSAPIPSAFDAALDASRVQVWRDGRALADLPLRVALELEDVALDRTDPPKSQGKAHASLDAGALHTTLEASKRGDTLDYDFFAQAKQLADVRPWLSDDLAGRAPWEKMAFELRSSGRVQRVTSAAPELQQHAELQLTGAAFDSYSTRAIALDLHSSGSALRQNVHAELRTQAIAIGDTALGDEHLTLTASIDRTAPSAHIEVTGDRSPKANFSASAAYDRTHHVVTYDVAGDLSGLSPLAPLLANVSAVAAIDPNELALQFKSQGSLTGLVTGVEARGMPQMTADLSQVGGSATVEVSAAHVLWEAGEQSFRAPFGTWHATLRGDGGKRSVVSDFSADRIDLGSGQHRIGIAGLQDQTSISLTGGVATGVIEFSQRVTIRSLKQDFAPMYPVADLSASVSASRDADGVIKISDLHLENQVGGTLFVMRGGIDLSAEQRRLSLRLNVKQDLAKVCNRAELFTGRGDAVLDFSVESPDFRVFHTRSTLNLTDAQLKFPRAKVDLETVDGEVPIVSDLTVSADGVELLRGMRVNPYATLRFADQHPLLQNRSFLSIASLNTPFISIAPFAANLKVEQNIVSLSQLEMGVRGGSITGDAVFDWNGPQSTLQADVRASGVKSSHGEPFDGNAALLVDIGDRSVEGRADILRIGRRHLLDLLDLQDPHRTNAAMNRIRGVLSYGYPERVRIAFKHGFASAGVTFGGLASLVSVDDVRGIPIGPLMDKIVNSFSPEEEP